MYVQYKLVYFSTQESVSNKGDLVYSHHHEKSSKILNITPLTSPSFGVRGVMRSEEEQQQLLQDVCYFRVSQRR
jgi:hypothetical protein